MFEFIGSWVFIGIVVTFILIIAGAVLISCWFSEKYKFIKNTMKLGE